MITSAAAHRTMSRSAPRVVAVAAAVALAGLLCGCSGSGTVAAAASSRAKSTSTTAGSSGSTPSASSTELATPGGVSGGKGVGAVKIVEGKAFCKAFDELDTTLNDDPKTPAEAVARLHAAAESLRQHGTPAALAPSVATIADDFDKIADQFSTGALTEHSIGAAMAGIGAEYATAFGDVIKWSMANCS